MKNSLRLVTLAVLAAVGLGMVTPTAAHASKQGKRNTALALGAVAVYGLVKKKPAIAGLAGAGAVYSWIQSNKDDDNRDRRRNRNRRYDSVNYGDRYSDSGYRDNYDGGYRGRGNYGNTGYSDRYNSRGSYGRSRSYQGTSGYGNGRHSSGRGGRRCD